MTLPAWPLGAMVGLYPLWWALGTVDFMWLTMAAAMTLYLARLGPRIEVPRGFGAWLLFLAWMTLSASQVDTLGRMVGFSYRALHYYAATVLFIYLYNARKSLTDRLVTGLLTLFWGVTVLGGFLGMMLQEAVFRTPASYVLPDVLVNNSLVNHMVVRRFAQYDPDGWVVIDPRPSAPFLYTNNWGNAYSLLLPFVVAYLCKVYGERRFWWIVALLPVSLIPAMATLNRGMFLGIAVSALYLAVRYFLLGNVKVLLAVSVLGAAAVIAVTQFGAAAELDSRLEQSGTNNARMEIYQQTLASTQDAPVFGMGAPRPSENPNIPPVGTHGQFWIVLHSHGVPAVVLFMGWLGHAFVRSTRRTDATGVLAASALLAGLVEAFYYGFLPVGLHLLMIAAGVALRGQPHPQGGEMAIGNVRTRAEVSR